MKKYIWLFACAAIVVMPRAHAAETADAQTQLQAHVTELVERFQDQWTGTDFPEPTHVPDDQVTCSNGICTGSVPQILNNNCNAHMRDLISYDKSLDVKMIFPIEFEARVSKGVKKKPVEGTQDQNEVYKSIERYHVVAAVKITDCATTCDIHAYAINGAERRRVNSCTSKPLALITRAGTFERLPDYNEFTGIDGWDPIASTK